MRFLFTLAFAVLFALASAAAAYAQEIGYSILGSYRKDIFLPDFPESIPYSDPTDGGRVHLVVNSSSCSTAAPLKSVKINGQEALNLPSSGTLDFSYFDWARVQLQSNSNGRILISFHSRNNDWLPASGATSLNVSVVDSNGAVCVSGTTTLFNAVNTVLLSYATTQADGSELVFHLHNADARTRQVQWVEINGVAEFRAGPFLIGAGQTHAGVMKLAVPLSSGDLWTVSMFVDGEVSAQAWGGRVIPERFPIEVWPHSDDCPIPGLNDTNAQQLMHLGIDTAFVSSAFDKCTSKMSIPELISNLAATQSDFRVWTSPDILQKVSNNSNVDAVFLGDEVDGLMDANLRTTAAMEANTRWPGIPTYQGGKTNRHIGSYAGITDYQGMDAYCAACAPTMVNVVHNFPILYPYHYLRNARDNHAPLPTVLYSQVYGNWPYQANQNEIVVQIAQAIAAGAKGLSLFQSVAHDFETFGSQFIRQTLHSITNPSVREALRSGDIGGLQFSSTSKQGEEVFIEAIRSAYKVVLLVANVHAHGYSNLLCHVDVDKHWIFQPVLVDAIVISDSPVPLSSFAEVVDGQIMAPQSGVQIEYSANAVKITHVAVGSDLPLRIFVFDTQPDSVTVHAPIAAAPLQVNIIQTAEHASSEGQQADRLKPLPPVPMTTSSSPGVNTIRIDPTEHFQVIRGFGGAFTDSSAFVFSKLKEELQEQVLELLWGASGQKYNLARLTIGSTDFSTAAGYSYAEVPNDFAMRNFSIAHDEDKIIPMIRRAQAKAATAQSGIEFLATPWSPPAWMKRNARMRNSEVPCLVHDERIHESYALYLSKYVSAMKEHGITISRLTIQNEPHVKGQFLATYPCCGLNATEELVFLRDYLGPQMRNNHPEVELFVHDDQKNYMVDYVTTIMSDAVAASFVDGVAFHWYGDNLQNYQYLQQLHDKFPALPLVATEASLEAPETQLIGSTPWKEALKYAVDIIGDLNAWTEAWIEWNVLLDSSGGPTCIGPSDTDICVPLIGHCDAPILADVHNQSITVRDSYWHMAHFSRFIPSGSVRIGQTGATDTAASLMAVSVLTPDSTVVVIVLNRDEKQAAEYQVELVNAGTTTSQFAVLSIPPHGIQTLSIKL